MNTETVQPLQPPTININESYFFKAEFALWTFFSVSFITHISGLPARSPFIELMLQLSVTFLAIYAAIVPFIKSRYHLEDLSSAIFNIAGIILLTVGAFASIIYKMPWGANVFMAGFCCSCYYHMQSPFRERTYQQTNEIEDKLIWLFVIGSLLSFPACFMHENIFPYPSSIFLVTSGLGFWILSYTLLAFCWNWHLKKVQNYLLLSYLPRILIMLYFAKGYNQFMVLGTYI